MPKSDERTHEPDSDNPAALRHVLDLIRSIKVCMLTTAGDDGRLHSRPMSAQLAEPFDGDLYFLTAHSSLKVHELERDRHVALAFADPGKNRFCSVSGYGEVLRDRDTVERFWTVLALPWFPRGPQDPDLCVLRLRVSHAEFWDSPAGPVVLLAGLFKAALTGRPAQPGPDEHDVVALRDTLDGAEPPSLH